MKQIFTIWLFTICCFAYSQKTNNLSFKLDSMMPVRGLCLAAPQPKDIMICDWHYDRPDPTPVYFAMKGFNVVTCPWKNPESTELQVQDMVKYRKHSTPEMSEHFMGMVQTIWSGTEEFLESYYGRIRENGEDTQVNCFKAMNEEIMKIVLMK
jgi:hypothetical protein